MTTPEVRLERLRPDGIDAALDRAPIAWIPLGALEFHADHLPNGTDGLTGHGLLVAAAERIGGVVLPWSYLTMGTLALPWSFRFDPGLVEEALRQTLRQLPAYGVRLAVVHTGHGPLDLNHLIKRVCAEVAADGSGLQAMGLCYLELNAALGTGLGTDWPVAVDHGSTMETSWVAALEPDLVDVDRLPDDPAATRVGVYGPNPRFTVDAARGAAQIDAAAATPGRTRGRGAPGRAARPVRGPAHVRRALLAGSGSCWRAGPGRPAMPRRRRPSCSPTRDPCRATCPASRCSSTARRSRATSIALVNPTVGETGVAVRASELGPERGFYIRRQQTAEVRLPDPVRRRAARGPPRPLAGRGHGDGARRDGRVPVSAVGPGRMVRTVRGPVDPATLGITTDARAPVDGFDAAPRGPWLRDDRRRPVGRRDRRRSPLEPGRPHGQLPPDRRRRGGRGAGAVRPSRWRARSSS